MGLGFGGVLVDTSIQFTAEITVDDLVIVVTGEMGHTHTAWELSTSHFLVELTSIPNGKLTLGCLISSCRQNGFIINPDTLCHLWSHVALGLQNGTGVSGIKYLHFFVLLHVAESATVRAPSKAYSLVSRVSIDHGCLLVLDIPHPHSRVHTA